MTVTISDVQEAIKSLFGETPRLLEADNSLIFGLNLYGYVAHGCIRIFDSAETKHQANRSRIGMSLTFTEQANVVLDLRNIANETVLEVCNAIQQCVDWGSVSSIKIPSGAVEVSMYCAWTVTEADLRLVQTNPDESQLVDTLDLMSTEFVSAASILTALKSGAVKDAQHVKLMMRDLTEA